MSFVTQAEAPSQGYTLPPPEHQRVLQASAVTGEQAEGKCSLVSPILPAQVAFPHLQWAEFLQPSKRRTMGTQVQAGSYQPGAFTKSEFVSLRNLFSFQASHTPAGSPTLWHVPHPWTLIFGSRICRPFFPVR